LGPPVLLGGLGKELIGGWLEDTRRAFGSPAVFP
jgi:hypothetical protein